jgi:hypothetical protein
MKSSIDMGGKFYVGDAERKVSWQEARDFCVGKGDDLVSIKNYEDIQAIRFVKKGKNYWIGGTDEGKEDEWKWVDGSPWPNKTAEKCSEKSESSGSIPCQSWAAKQSSGGKIKSCLVLSKNRLWETKNCAFKNSFLCKRKPSKLKQISSKTYKWKDLIFDLWKNDKKYSQIEISWKYTLKKEMFKNTEKLKMPGFKVKWQLQNSNEIERNKRHEIRVGDVIQEKYGGYKSEYAKKITKQHQKYQIIYQQFILKAKCGNMSNESILKLIKDYKANLVYRNLIECESGFLSPDSYGRMFDALASTLPKDLPNQPYNGTQEDCLMAFDVLSYLINCNDEAVKMFIFYKSLILTKNLRTITQSTMNTLKLMSLKESTASALQDFFSMVMDEFKFELPKILMALSGASLIKNTRKWTINYQKEIEECSIYNNCDKINKILNNLGKYSVT